MGQFSLAATSSGPVTTTELRDHLRITSTDQDTYLATLLSAARETAEAHTKLALVRKQVKYYLNNFPAGDIVFYDHNPVRSVSSISYKEPTSGVATTLSTADYNIDYKAECLRVYPAVSTGWPSVYSYSDAKDNVTVTVLSGFKSTHATRDSTADVSENVKAGIKLYAEHLYSGADTTQAAGALWDQESVVRFG